MRDEQLAANPQVFRWPKEPFIDRHALRWNSANAGVAVPGAPESHYQCFWGRNGIYHSLGFMGISPGDRILVPAYLCSAAIEPILAYGAEVDFYRITRECRPDFDHVETSIRPRTRGILLVHYFGFPAEVRVFQEICNRHDLVLIEDCAHVLEGRAEGRALGAIGDASIFSWRKFLPVYDGSTLVVNRPRQEYGIPWQRESILFDIKVAVNLFDHVANSGRHSVLRSLDQAIRQTRSLWTRYRRNDSSHRRPIALDMNTLRFDPDLLDLPISRVSRWILDHSNVAWIKARRARNYEYLLNALLQAPGLTPLRPLLPRHVCPWVFPVLLDSMQAGHLTLRNHGIPAVTWGGVKHPTIQQGAYPDADFLYENLVFLPIHQDLDEKDLSAIAQTVRASLGIRA